MRTTAKMTYAGALFAGLLAVMCASSSVHAQQVSNPVPEDDDNKPPAQDKTDADDSSTGTGTGTGSVLGGGTVQSASGSYIQTCIDKWESSEAYDHCSSASVNRISASAATDPGHCEVSGSCSITVDVDDASTTFTPSVDVTESPSDTRTLDICFAEDSTATSGFSATVKAGCASTETDSDDAADNGLSTGA